MKEDKRTVIIKPRKKPGPIALAIANYINRRAETLRLSQLCRHDWETIEESKVWAQKNPSYTWKQFTYVCRKCKEVRKADTKQ